MRIHKVRHQPVIVGEEDELNHHPTMQWSQIFSARTWVINVTKENLFDMKEVLKLQQAVRYQPVVVREHEHLHHQ